MMGFCKNCFDNNWGFKKVEDWIYATCKACGYEVSFLTKKARKRRELETPHIILTKKGKLIKIPGIYKTF